MGWKSVALFRLAFGAAGIADLDDKVDHQRAEQGAVCDQLRAERLAVRQPVKR